MRFVEPSRIDARRIFGTLQGEISRLENKYSRYLADSLLSQINADAGNPRGTPIDNETRSLLDHAWNCYQLSDGLFDITSGVLRRVWDFSRPVVPDQKDIERLLPLIGMSRIQWNDTEVRLPRGMEIDFGGLVKEYTADSVARLALSLGLQHGLINLGGDVRVIGPLPDGQPWPVSIVDPTTSTQSMANLLMPDGGLASSGDYERCFIHKGRRYSHLLNPRTGWPCEGLRAVSVWAETCTVAGSAATIAMLKPELEGIFFLEELGLNHVYMQSDAQLGGKGIDLARQPAE